MGAKAKKIELYLHNGTLNGLTYVSESDGWDLGGILYSCPRESVDILLNDDSCDKYGVYLLISSDKVYVGQSTDLKKRIKQHLIGKDWWEKVILLTSKNDELNQSYITYLESTLISRAIECGTIDCENKTDGNRNNLDKFTKILLDQYLDEALFIMELIGVEVFSKGRKKQSIVHSIPTNSEENIAIRAKGEVVKFLKDKGFECLKIKVFAKLQENKGWFWVNPRTEYLEQDWDLILNNQLTKTIYILRIPAHFFNANNKNRNSLVVRKDKPYYLDLNIDSNTFIDKRSKVSFRNLIIKEIKY